MTSSSPSHALLLLLLASILLTPACGDKVPSTGGSEEDPAAAWGDPVGELALSLELPHRSFAESEQIIATVRARNLGSTPLTLPAFEDGMWWYRVQFENVGEGPDFTAGSGLFLDFESRPDATLAPGATWTKTPELTSERRRYLRVIENRKPGDDWDYRPCLPPGDYRAWIEFSFQGAEDAWNGRVRSNVVEVQIAALGMRDEGE